MYNNYCTYTHVHVHVSVCLLRLPDYACKFLEICLMVCADHGPAVSGAHNTIVTARAGKDLVSSLASGLLTIVRSGRGMSGVGGAWVEWAGHEIHVHLYCYTCCYFFIVDSSA